MVAVGFLLLWGGYGTGLFGWCLLRDYDVTLGQLMSPFHPYAGPWPPATIPASQIWPGGAPASSTGSGSSTPTPAQVGTAAAGSPSIIDKIADTLPGLGFIK
jgi:hypothetical protein